MAINHSVFDSSLHCVVILHTRVCCEYLVLTKSVWSYFSITLKSLQLSRMKRLLCNVVLTSTFISVFIRCRRTSPSVMGLVYWITQSYVHEHFKRGQRFPECVCSWPLCASGFLPQFVNMHIKLYDDCGCEWCLSVSPPPRWTVHVRSALLTCCSALCYKLWTLLLWLWFNSKSQWLFLHILVIIFSYLGEMFESCFDTWARIHCFYRAP